MADKSEKVKLEQAIQAPLQEVYSAFTNATALCEWLCTSAQADSVPGGRLYLYWDGGYYASGEYISLTPDEKVSFSWRGRDEPGSTRVRINLKPAEDGTLLSLVHDGFGSGKPKEAS